jgi:putative spermidine/putrescine transport system permease protein
VNEAAGAAHRVGGGPEEAAPLAPARPRADEPGAGSLTSAGLTVPATLVVVAVLGLPLVLLFRYSLNQYDRYDMMVETFTLQNYAAIVSDPFFRNVLLRTIAIAAISTAITAVLAFPVAYFIARAPARWKSLLIICVVFPLLVGNLVRAAGWMAVMGNRGFLNQALIGLGVVGEPLEILYTPAAVVTGIVAVVLPFMILTLQSVLENIDPSLEEAAGSLGARPITTFRRVVLPLALPGVIAGTALVFILCMNAYATPVLLGGPRFHVMGPQVYQQIVGQSNWPFGGALAFVLMGTTLVLTVVSTTLIQRRYRR